MKEYLQIIKNTALFSGIADDEIESMLHCFGAKEKSYGKGQYILRAGDSVASVGLLLAGSALIMQEDLWGNRNIIHKIMPSGLFAEAFACSPGAVLNVSAAADEECTVLWIDVSRIMTTCPSACAHHSRMIQNLLSDFAAKNLRLSEKITHMGQRTTREKVLSYLSAQAQKRNSRIIDIPFNRQQLADYLSVERSALSAELSKLRADGMIDYHKNRFTLKQRGKDTTVLPY